MKTFVTSARHSSRQSPNAFSSQQHGRLPPNSKTTCLSSAQSQERLHTLEDSQPANTVRFNETPAAIQTKDLLVATLDLSQVNSRDQTLNSR